MLNWTFLFCIYGFRCYDCFSFSNSYCLIPKPLSSTAIFFFFFNVDRCYFTSFPVNDNEQLTFVYPSYTCLLGFINSLTYPKISTLNAKCLKYDRELIRLKRERLEPLFTYFVSLSILKHTLFYMLEVVFLIVKAYFYYFLW